MVARLARIDEDPVLALVQHAPLVEATADEDAAFEEGLRDIRAGCIASGEKVRVRLRTREE